MTVVDTSPEIVLKDAVVHDLARFDGTEVQVRDAVVERSEDLTGAQAWRALLYLPRPTGRTWSTTLTRELKSAARESLDRHALEMDLDAEGATSVAITTTEGDEADFALPDEPEPEELPVVEDDDATQ